MTRPMSAATVRRKKLTLLKALLEEFGEVVLKSGKSLRVAGGTLRLSRRKASRMYNPATGEKRTCPEVLRLVWRGPVLGVVSETSEQEP